LKIVKEEQTMRSKSWPLIAVVFLGLLTGGCWTLSVQQTFDGQRAYQHVIAQCDLGPRPTGSAAGWATGDYIIAQLEGLGWAVTSQEFTYKGVKGRNIVGQRGKGPIIILGAHYDTRPYADYDPVDKDQPILGANDGASGVAVLLELARSLDEKVQNEVWLAFFDAEDRGKLDGWPFSVGAEFFADALKETPEYVIVVDMIGDADQNVFFEHNSDATLQEQIWAVAASLDYQEYFIPQYKWSITDDHMPFAKRGITAVDIIDFDYPHWHTTQDTPDKVSPESLQRVGRVLEELLEGKE
jgi:Zn-dependent M28 family amino/carboxypeptidase